MRTTHALPQDPIADAGHGDEPNAPPTGRLLGFVRTRLGPPAVGLALGLAPAAVSAQTVPAPATDPRPPPPPGEDPGFPDPEPGPSSAFGANDDPPRAHEVPLAGWDDGLYVRDPSGLLWLHPGLRIDVDTRSFFGPGIADVSGADGGSALRTRILLRTVRLELAGRFLRRFSFLAAGEFDGQAVVNPNGTAETSAGPAGRSPTAETARFAAVEGPAGGVAFADAWIGYAFNRRLNLLVGQTTTPVTTEGRADDARLTFPERSLAVRAFVSPSPRELGFFVWGESVRGLYAYDFGFVGGDGANRPLADGRADVLGRIAVRPFALGRSPLRDVEIAVGARHGQRDPANVGYDVAAITSGFGVVLWSPTYRDAAGRRLHVLPSGAQNTLGGSLRLPVGRFALQAEAFWVAQSTREAVEGYQLTNTERLGRFDGLGWTAQVSLWPAGDAFVSGAPAPRRVRRAAPRVVAGLGEGLEIGVRMSGIHARYDGAERGGARDPTTPAGDVDVVEYGLVATWWQTKHLRASIAYALDLVPESGTAANLATVPGNAGPTPDPDAHVIHELGTRIGISF